MKARETLRVEAAAAADQHAPIDLRAWAAGYVRALLAVEGIAPATAGDAGDAAPAGAGPGGRRAAAGAV